MKTEIIPHSEKINYGFYAIKNCNCVSISGQEYELLFDKLLGIGGESYVYKCRKIADGKEYAIKYFINDRIDNYRTKEREEKYKFLNSISNKCNIVNILDWGTIEITYNFNSEVNVVTFYFEIMPIFDEDISSIKLTYKDIRNRLLPDMLNVLNVLHNNNYVHRDINPKNIFILNGKYYLGDAGIMRKIEKESNGYGFTSTIAGTLGFTAPEVSLTYFSSKSDYYSLGCVLAYAYLGHHPYQKEIDEQRYNIHLLIKKHGMPIEAKEYETDLQDLIDHLCDVDEDNRPGYDDVNLWIKNSKEFIGKYKNIKSSKDYTYTFDGKEYCNPEDLAIAMSDNWEEALNHLQGGINGSPLFDYLNYNQDIKAKAINIYSKEIDYHSSTKEREVVLSKILFLMLNKKMFVFKTLKFKSLNELKNKSNEILIQILRSSYLSWAINEIDNLDKAKYKTISIIENISRLNEKIAVNIYNNLSFVNDSFNNFDIKRNSIDFTSICEQIANDYYLNIHLNSSLDNNIELWTNVFLSGNQDYVVEYQKQYLHRDSIDKIIYIFEMFEKIDEKRISIYRKIFFEKGPLSYLGWFKEHLNFYKFNTISMGNLKNYIDCKSLSNNDSIKKQIEDFQDLKVSYERIIEKIDNNILANKLSKKEVTVLYSDGLLCEFKNTKIPCGFLNMVSNEYINTPIKDMPVKFRDFIIDL